MYRILKRGYPKKLVFSISDFVSLHKEIHGEEPELDVRQSGVVAMVTLTEQARVWEPILCRIPNPNDIKNRVQRCRIIHVT